MQSRTSFFNASIFKKSVTRFWPVWGGYTAAWVITVLSALLSRYSSVNSVIELQSKLLNIGYAGGLITGAIFGVFSAMAVWSFAYSTRSAHAMACLPVRREGVFTAVTMAGLLPFVAANAAITVLTLLAELAVGVVDLAVTLQMFALMTLPFLLFYGFAVFCAQMTGNILALPAVYAVLNFVCVGVEVLVRALACVFVYGMAQGVFTCTLRFFSPVVGILMNCKVARNETWDGEVYLLKGYTFQGWGVLVTYAVIGLVLMALALLLFRRRKMETAGDVVAVEVLKPVFRWCMAIGCALCLSVLFYLLFWENGYAHGGSTLCLISLIFVMLVGAFCGWFIAEMMMKKSFRVFRSGWGGLGVCCLILAALLCACEFDLFGYEKYVPTAEKVESVNMNCMGEYVTLESPESIEQVLALHESIVANKAWHEGDLGHRDWSDNYSTLQLTYWLRSGRWISREYDLRYTEEKPGDMSLVQAVINCAEAISDRKETAFPITEESIYDSGVYSVMTAADCAAAAGYGSAEEYVLREYCGVSGAELDSMTGEERADRVYEAVLTYAVNGLKTRGYYPAAAAAEDTAEISRPDGSYDLDHALFRYYWNFTPRQMIELYETCILPDIADGTLGRVWILPDEPYRNTVYDTQIEFSARQRRVTADGTDVFYGDGAYRYEHFSTTPTVDSARTNAWLAAHGVKQYTLAELYGSSAL